MRPLLPSELPPSSELQPLAELPPPEVLSSQLHARYNAVHRGTRKDKMAAFKVFHPMHKKTSQNLRTCGTKPFAYSHICAKIYVVKYL